MEAFGDSVDVLLVEEMPPLAQSDTSPLIDEEELSAPEGVGEAYVGREEAANDTTDEAEVEGDFVDAEALPSSGNAFESVGSLPIRAPVSDDVEEDDDNEDEEEEAEGEDDEGSFVSDESYDSAVASTVDVSSRVGSFTESFAVEAEDTPQQGALRQLNKLNSGVSSLDPSLLHNSSEDEFKSRVARIAETKNLSPNDSIVRNILDALLPIFSGRFKSSGPAGDTLLHDANSSGDYSRIMPVAKPTVEDDDDKEPRKEGAVDQAQHDTQNQVGTDGAADDRVHPESAQGLRVRGVDDVSDNPNDSTASSSSLLELPEEGPVASLDLNTAREEVPRFEFGKESVEKEEVENQTFGGAMVVTEMNNAVPSLESGKESVGEEGVESQEQKVTERDDEVRSLESVEESLEKEEVESHATGGATVVEQEQEVTERDDCLAEFSNGVPVEESVVDADLKPVSGPEALTESSGLDSNVDEFLHEHGNSEQGTSEGVDAIRLKQEPETSCFSNPAAGDATVINTEKDGEPVNSQPIKGDEIEKLATDGESRSNLEEVTKLASETGTGSERNLEVLHPRDEAGLQPAPSAEQSPLEAVEQKEKEDGGNPEEDAEGEDDPDDREEESTDISPAPPAFINSKASAARATDTPSLGGAGPSLPQRPAGLGRSIPSLEPASRVVQRSSGASLPSRGNEGSRQDSDVSEGNDEAQEKLQMIRVKFLRLAHRLGQSAHNVVVAQVLYRLGLAEQLRGGRSATSRAGGFSFERASILAEEQEAAGQDELDFGCTIMVLGKSGVGKSATINSIFDDTKSGTDAYSPGTKTVREITGTIHGIKLRVIDTPGLLPSFADQRHNAKIMLSVKRLIRKSPPDIVLYFDRLDMQSRDYGDLPLLRTITDTFGAAIWFNAIVVLTHASSAPPDGANGVPLSYEMFVAQRSHVVQQTIRQAAGDMRLMNPVSLVENHAACRTNRAGQRVLPNGQVWKPQLLLLCFASKILAEANSLLKLQDGSPGKPFGIRSRVPPLPFLLSSLLQSRAQLKFPDEQMVDDDDDEFDEDSEEEGGSDGEEEYDDLPPFRRLTKDELGLLDDEQRKIYFEEMDYREKLFMKQQWKEERSRRREMKRKIAAAREESQLPDESMDEDNAGSAAVPVPMPDMALPPSFDADNPSHRYRYLDTASQWLVRPVLETHGWDHDSGYDGLNIEKAFVILNRIPASISGQVTKDKKEANLQMECAASFKNGEGKVTLAGVDVQTIGKDLAYTLRSETRFSNFKRNKTTCGLALTFLGDTMAAGMKLEDQLKIGRRVKLVINGGAITGRGDVAYGGSLEATLRDKDYPIVQTLSTLGLSIMDWHGDLAIGGNFQSQFMLGKNMMIARANLNNRGAGQISIRASSSEQVQMALIGLIPLLRAFIGNRFFSSTQ